MADISRVTLLNGQTYDLKDSRARALATATDAGQMSSTDKNKLDNLIKISISNTTPTISSVGDIWFIIEEENAE